MGRRVCRNFKDCDDLVGVRIYTFWNDRDHADAVRTDQSSPRIDGCPDFSIFFFYILDTWFYLDFK